LDVAVKAQMRWIRLNRRIGAWAALFALAVQITLSFGHIHVGKLALLSGSAAATSSAQTADRDGAPSAPDRHTGANDFCAICATISLVASSVLPESACLALPIAEPSAWPRKFEATFSSFDSHFLFQARAPPFVA
jgi:hypothetical protein